LLIRHADTFGYLKAQIIRRIGHIVGTNKERTVKRVTEWRTFAVRRAGTLRLRWEDNVVGDLGKMKIQNLSKMAMDR
jgi:hypothetical protein